MGPCVGGESREDEWADAMNGVPTGWGKPGGGVLRNVEN